MNLDTGDNLVCGVDANCTDLKLSAFYEGFGDPFNFVNGDSIGACCLF